MVNLYPYNKDSITSPLFHNQLTPVHINITSAVMCVNGGPHIATAILKLAFTVKSTQEEL